MKREFAFENALRVLEVTWSSLPPATADTMIQLWETRFSPVVTPSTLELAKPCETAYGKVRDLRKQTLDRSKSQELDQLRGRIKSETAAGSVKKRPSLKQFEKSKSLANVNQRRKHLKSSATESIEEETDKAASDDKSDTNPPGKKLKSLNQFYSLPGQSEPTKETPEKSKEDNKSSDDMNNITSPCAEVIADVVDVDGDDPFDWVGYSQANSALTVYCNRLPPPPQFGHGNPFLMFLCLACLLEQRDHIIKSGLDYQDIAMYFDKLVRGHDVVKVLVLARRLFAEYLNEDWTPSPQPSSVPNC